MSRESQVIFPREGNHDILSRQRQNSLRISMSAIALDFYCENKVKQNISNFQMTENQIIEK